MSAALESSPLTPLPPSPVRSSDKRANEAEGHANLSAEQRASAAEVRVNLKLFAAPYPPILATTARPSPVAQDPLTLMGSASPTPQSKPQQASAPPSPRLIPSAAQTTSPAPPRKPLQPLLKAILRKLTADTPAHAPAVSDASCEAALQDHREDIHRRAAPPPQRQYGGARDASMAAESEGLSEELSDSEGRARATSRHTSQHAEPRGDNRYHTNHPDYDSAPRDRSGSSYRAYGDDDYMRRDHSDSDRTRRGHIRRDRIAHHPPSSERFSRRERSPSPVYDGHPGYYQCEYSPRAVPSRRPYQEEYHHPPAPPRRPRQDPPSTLHAGWALLPTSSSFVRPTLTVFPGVSRYAPKPEFRELGKHSGRVRRSGRMVSIHNIPS